MMVGFKTPTGRLKRLGHRYAKSDILFTVLERERVWLWGETVDRTSSLIEVVAGSDGETEAS